MDAACPTQNPGGNEQALSATYASNITYTHNTIRAAPTQYAKLVQGAGGLTPFPGGQRNGALNFTFKDNISNFGNYGMTGSVVGATDCQASNAMWQPNGPVTGSTNIIINNYPGGSHNNPTDSYCGSNRSAQFPLGTVVANDAAVGFVNIAVSDAGGDYHDAALAANSPFKGRASDGKDPGVDFAALDAALGPLASNLGLGSLHRAVPDKHLANPLFAMNHRTILWRALSHGTGMFGVATERVRPNLLLVTPSTSGRME
jgi:hypothetical protein